MIDDGGNCFVEMLRLRNIGVEKSGHRFRAL
jgi:hypothetical protein